jgi:hypothetical protein
MSNLQPLRIHAQPESAEQAAQLVAHHTAGAYELIGGAVLGFQTGVGLDLWPFAWPGPDGAAAVRAVHALHEHANGTAQEDLPIETAWTCLCLNPPYATALARVTVAFPSLPTRPHFACWIDARQHRPLLQQIADQRRLLIFATKPPLPALMNPAALIALPALTLTFEPDLQIVDELLGQLGA